jgi:hypothetical protein
MGPWKAFDVWNWSLDAQLDFLFPAVAVLLVAWLAGYGAK